MLGTFMALDLILFFLFFEVVLAPMWFLIAFWGSGERRRSANTFILYTVLGSVVMLLGFLVVIVDTGSADMVALANGLGARDVGERAADGRSADPRWARRQDTDVAAAHLASGRPHRRANRWLGASGRGTAQDGHLRDGAHRRPDPPGRDGGASLPTLAAFAVVGILYGALASYGQDDLKRVIAFSSVGHMGFVLLGISTLSVVGINAALFGNIAHGLITGLLFFVVGGIKQRTGSTAFADLPRGLYASAPRLGFLLGFAAVASLGMPGLAGFWGEFLALVGAYHPARPGAPVLPSHARAWPPSAWCWLPRTSSGCSGAWVRVRPPSAARRRCH